MPFPPTPRVFYNKNPLASVVCQLRFPAILRIAAEPPSEFQESVRSRFPLYQEQREPLVELGLPDELAKVVIDKLSLSGGGITFNFLSTPQRWKIALSREFLALEDKAYRRWEEFKECLEYPLRALEVTYKPSFYERVGLRYRNVITRSELGLDGVPWRELLAPQVAGELSDADVAAATIRATRETVISLEELGRVHIRHGLGVADYGDGKTEQVYIIDTDFFREGQTECTSARQLLDDLNKQSGRAFRWCITDRLAGAMGREDGQRSV